MICDTCQWYAPFEGVCCNGLCEWCAGWPPYDLEQCEFWEDEDGQV